MKKTFLLIVFMGCVLFSQADNVIVEHYSTEHGLAHETVTCMLKSSDGFLWFGTWHGLCSFDGKEIQTYNSGNKFQIDTAPRKIQNIFEDKFGNLWLKTIDHKLYVFDKKREQFHALHNRLPKEFSLNSQIIKVVETDAGKFLLLTKNKDLLLATPKENVIVDISILYKSENVTGDVKLTKNILFENADFISWIGMDFSILYHEKGDELRKKSPTWITEELSKLTHQFLTSATEMNEILWLGTENGKILKVNLSDAKIEEYDGLLNIGEIQCIVPCSKSEIYVSIRDQGIHQINIDKSKVYAVSTKNDDIISYYCDNYGLLWFETSNNTIIRFDSQKQLSHRFEFPAKQRINESSMWQNGGELGLFFLAFTGDVYHMSREEPEMKLLEAAENSIQKTEVNFSNFLYDENGVLWLSSFDEGFFQISFPKEQFRLFDPHSGYLNLSETTMQQIAIKALFKDENGDIWIGNRKSEVLCFDKNGNLKHQFSSANYNIGNVYHIMKDKSGVFWFSTKGQGLVSAVRDETKTLGYQFERYLHDKKHLNSISSNDVYFTYQDNKDRIWIATFGGGLNLVQKENNFTVFKHKYNSFSNYPEFGQYLEVRNLIEDEYGRMWVGTSDGLLSFEVDFETSQDIKFKTYKKGGNSINNDIYNLFKDSENNIWMSVFGVGLNRLVDFDPAKEIPVIESFGIKNGLNSDVILSMTEDDDKNLWLSTERGISVFNPNARTFRNFDKYDGLPPVTFEESSALHLSKESILFGTKNGVLQFDPHEITTSTIEYPIYIVDMKVTNLDFEDWNTENKSVKYLDEIVLKHNQSMFSIEFAALNFYTQNHLRYKYILEGYEKEWHESGKNRIASYTNMPHGKYTFKVKALDETNPHLISEKILQIRILPPWWKTPWAYFIYIILILTAVYAISRHAAMIIRMKNDVYVQQELSDLKIKFFTNVSHELRTPLTLIKGPITELKENEKLSEKGLKYMNLMEKNTNHMLSLVNQILDFRKIENKKMKMRISLFELNGLLKSSYDEFFHLSIENEIGFDYHLLEDEVMVWADREKIETVVRNIVSNAFKFTASGGTVLLTCGLDEKENRCFIRVEDSGIGIPENKLEEVFERFSQCETNQLGTGIGLALTKELVTLHHGSIKVESVQNQGSVFTVSLPMGKEHFREDNVEFYLSDNVEAEIAVGISLSETVEDVEEDAVLDPDLPILLVVEDNRSLSDLLKMQLEDKYTVYSAVDGEDGFKKTHLYHPDVVITDQMMPNVTGLEMLEKIRNDFQISHIPVIILTAKNDDETRIHALHLGANAYITKPFSKRHLIVRVNQLLSDRKRFREKLWSTSEENQPENNYGEYLVEKDKEFLLETHNIIEDNIDNIEFSIDAISDAMGLSRSAFFKKLKSITGLAPVDLVKEVRLNKSVELMKTTDMTISEIAFAVGFRDSGYFGKCFRKKFEMTPREYANEHRNLKA